MHSFNPLFTHKSKSGHRSLNDILPLLLAQWGMNGTENWRKKHCMCQNFPNYGALDCLFEKKNAAQIAKQIFSWKAHVKTTHLFLKIMNAFILSLVLFLCLPQIWIEKIQAQVRKKTTIFATNFIRNRCFGRMHFAFGGFAKKNALCVCNMFQIQN